MNGVLTFEEWYDNTDPIVEPRLEDAYEAGWNACRDKWGGLTYEETNSLGFRPLKPNW